MFAMKIGENFMYTLKGERERIFNITLDNFKFMSILETGFVNNVLLFFFFVSGKKEL